MNSSDFDAFIRAAEDKIQQTQKAIQNQTVIQKDCEVYRTCRDVAQAEKDAPDEALYRKQHQTEYQLHDVTLKELAELGIHKLPSAEKLQRQQRGLPPSPKLHVFSRRKCATYSIRFL